jgi:RNA polymerase sigma-70 factor, ECF subfamily
MRSDRELIDVYKRGDEAAFREFYARHRKPLYVYLLSVVRDRETAEELLQETFFAFLRHLDRLNGSDDLRPFLVRTARNRAIDVLRRRKRGEVALQRRAEDPLFKPRPAGAAGAVDPDEVSALLRRLPDEQREVIVLKILVGMTFREIARVTGCGESSVVSRYRYGLGKLRAFALAIGGCVEGAR